VRGRDAPAFFVGEQHWQAIGNHDRANHAAGSGGAGIRGLAIRRGRIER
jgi:hypothetical protein